MRHHHLKTSSEYFDAVEVGDKNFEVRFNDRQFQTGDHVVLHRVDTESGEFADNDPLEFVISYVLHGFTGLAKGYVAFGLGKTGGCLPFDAGAEAFKMVLENGIPE